LELASFNERLLLGNGICVSPLKIQITELGTRSLRDVILQIDNERDCNVFISGFASKVGNTGDIKYERHPVISLCQIHINVTLIFLDTIFVPADSVRFHCPLSAFGKHTVLAH